MSDFDKEAEREKLREKFERDRQKRAQSERMSELLLKGATMTNKHHDCGSPIFRWEGEEFCPSCEGPNGAGGAETDAEATPDESGAAAGPDPVEGADATGRPAADAVDGTADAATDGVDDATEEAAGAADAAGTAAEGSSSGSDATEIDVAAEPAPDRGAGDPETGAGAAMGGEPALRTARPASAGTSGSSGADTEPPTAAEGVAAARASLERTLAALAREAEETPTTDLTRKRNLVAASREAAEALEATRRAGRQ